MRLVLCDNHPGLHACHWQWLAPPSSIICVSVPADILRYHCQRIRHRSRVCCFPIIEPRTTDRPCRATSAFVHIPLFDLICFLALSSHAVAMTTDPVHDNARCCPGLYSDCCGTVTAHAPSSPLITLLLRQGAVPLATRDESLSVNLAERPRKRTTCPPLHTHCATMPVPA